MAYAFVEDGTVTQYPVNLPQLKAAYPSTAFCLPLEGQDLSSFNAYPVEETTKPAINELTQKIEEGTPAFSDGAWRQVWNVVELTSDEIQDINVAAQVEVRAERDRKLAASDWTVLTDSPLTTAKKTEWKTYRTALRDISAAEGFPHTMEWPTQPS
jgi:hypothetical protein